ncbi:MAG: hypothetical protein R3B96_24350 [Pirellulaceae bacterium]
MAQSPTLQLSSQSTKETRELIEQNPNFFNNTDLLTINTSVDSLSPESPFLPVMLEAETAPWVHYHNVIGVLEDTSLLGKMGVQFQPEGDGIVPLDSARIPGVESELIVPAGHMVVHQHPLTILEVRRILLLHLAEGGRDVRIDRSIMPASHEQSPADVTGNHAIPASNPLPVVRLDDNGVPLAAEPQVAPRHARSIDGGPGGSSLWRLLSTPWILAPAK